MGAPQGSDLGPGRQNSVLGMQPWAAPLGQAGQDEQGVRLAGRGVSTLPSVGEWTHLTLAPSCPPLAAVVVSCCPRPSSRHLGQREWLDQHLLLS